MTAVQEHVITPAAPLPPMRPARYLVAARILQTYDTVTLLLRPADRPIQVPRPGQFTMLYAYGVGEIPVSVNGRVGLVTGLIHDAIADPARTAAFVCGPEIMMRLSAQALADAGIPARDIRVCIERNMRCGVALCGHCQLGPLLLCRDGPIVSYAEAIPLLKMREL